MPATIGVSVIVPCHNAEPFVAAALESLARQTYQAFECLVIDDASTDGSAGVVAQFAASDPRFRVLRLPENLGAAAARNAGLDEARGRWVTLLDADDLYLPDRLERLTDLGEARDADMVIDDLVVTAFPDVTPLYRGFGFSHEAEAFTQEEFFCRSRLFTASLAAGYMQPLIRRDFLLANGARYDPLVPSGEDFLFYGSLFARRPRCLAMRYAGYVYRRRPGSLSQSDTHLHVHAEQSERLLRDHAKSLSPESVEALAERARDFERLEAALPVIAAVRTRRWVEAARFLIAHPASARTCLRLLGARVRRRTSRDFRVGGGSVARAAAG